MAESVEFEAEVLRVIDGDSIIVKNEDGKFPIRIKYIDAPEIQQKHGKESKDFLSNLISGKPVFISSPYIVDTYLMYIFMTMKLLFTLMLN